MPPVFVWRTDVHLSDSTPRSRTDVWSTTVLNKLASVGKIAQSVGASAVLDGGDFFDLKSPGRTPHSLMRRIFETHRTHYTCPVYANVGNHDCVYGDYSYLHQQPLGVLFESGVFRRLYDEHEAVFTQDGVTVRVVGVPYHGTVYDMDRFARIKKGQEDFLVVMAHLLASPTKTSMFESEDVIRYDTLDAFDGDVFNFGHWHKNQGVRLTPGGKVIVNIGSLTRGSLSEDDLDRVPSVAILRFERGRVPLVEVVPVDHRPASEVFDLVKHETMQLREQMLDKFSETLAAILAVRTGGTVIDRVRAAEGIAPKIKERTLLYLEKAKA